MGAIAATGTRKRYPASPQTFATYREETGRGSNPLAEAFKIRLRPHSGPVWTATSAARDERVGLAPPGSGEPGHLNAEEAE